MKVNIKNLQINVFSLLLIGIVVVLIVLFIALFFSTGKSFDVAKLGSLGDFFGGILNPIFAFLAFLALLTTIILQASELKATRKELKKSASSLKKQSKTLKLQNIATKIQIFENTFFQMINVYANVQEKIIIRENTQYIYFINDIQNNFTTESNGDSNSKEAFRKIHYYLFQEQDKMNNLKEKIMVYTGIHDVLRLGYYFGYIYQIIKFIHSKAEENNKEFYVHLLRAQFSNDELILLLLHCLSEYGEEKFKPLLERYEFFEHIIYKENLNEYLTEYNIHVYGKNERIRKEYYQLK